ncbi:hypothetical protein ABID99_002873 [Mucilaginibacter sp. OAE612]
MVFNLLTFVVKHVMFRGEKRVGGSRFETQDLRLSVGEK